MYLSNLYSSEEMTIGKALMLDILHRSNVLWRNDERDWPRGGGGVISPLVWGNGWREGGFLGKVPCNCVDLVV